MTIPRLSETQLVILTAAAGRDDGAVLPIPKSLALRAGGCAKVLTSLLKHGRVEEHVAEAGAEPWREADDGQRMALTITATGLEAIGVDPDQGSAAAPKVQKRGRASRKPSPVGDAPRTRPRTKKAIVLDLLRCKSGASIPEVMEATGWQPHSVRGFLSGHVRKKLGHDVLSEKDGGGVRRYRIAA